MPNSHLGDNDFIISSKYLTLKREILKMLSLILINAFIRIINIYIIIISIEI